MNSDPLNNNKGTRTHPSLERLTRSFSEEERKFFVLWYSYWFLFFFFFHDRSTIVKTSIDCVFFLSIVVFSWTIGRCPLSPYPRGRTRGSISVFFRSRTWKIDDIPLSRRFPSAIQRIDCSRAARIDSIWTRLSKNFENRGMKTHNYMLSIVFFFHAFGPQHWKYVKVWINTRYSPWKLSSSRAGRVVSLVFYLGLSDDR